MHRGNLVNGLKTGEIDLAITVLPDPLAEIIVKVGDRFMIIDFATVKEIAHPNQSIVSRSTFAQGMKEYMPPEQLTGFTTLASDIYAIGRIAIHALTGISPSRLRINPQTGNFIWRDRVRRVEVSDYLAEVIDRATRYYFPNRYQSATEMLENLNNLGRW